MNNWDERNKVVIEEFRAHGGQVKGWAPLILLTTTGAKTGRSRIAPLMLVTDDDRIIAVASKGGIRNILSGISICWLIRKLWLRLVVRNLRPQPGFSQAMSENRRFGEQ